jgi:hypothetical protein
MASVLLLLGKFEVLSGRELIEKLIMDPKELEEVMKVLKSRRSGRLVLFVHQKFRINYEAGIEGEVVNLPFGFPTLPAPAEDKTKSTILLDRGFQVDGAAMTVMKQERSMEKVELKQRVKDILNFRLEEELFEKRLSHLAQNLYLKVDPSGRVHYLP